MSTNASFGISVCGFRWRAPVLKHEWILNCTTPHEIPRQRELTLLIDQISPRLLPWYLEFILNSELRIKYAETVPFPKFNFCYRLDNLRWHCYLRRFPIGQLLDCYITGYKYPVLSHFIHSLSYRQLAYFPEAKLSSTFLSLYSWSLILALKTF